MNESTLGFIHFIYQADFIARSILVVMLVASFGLLLLINTLQKWSNWRTRA